MFVHVADGVNGFILFYVFRAAAIFCAGVAWFFSTYSFPFVIGAEWVALCAIPITACVFIWRYGMNAAEEIRQEEMWEEESLYAMKNSDFPEPPPVTEY